MAGSDYVWPDKVASVAAETDLSAYWTWRRSRSARAELVLLRVTPEPALPLEMPELCREATANRQTAPVSQHQVTDERASA